MPLTEAPCPKSMTYGPCGGVRPDGSCEVDERRCPFVDRDTVLWAGTTFRPRDVEVPEVIVDHRPTGDPDLDRSILTGYRDLGVAVLLGDHLDDPPPVDRLATARHAIETGVATIATVTARNRGHDERRRLVSGLVDAGALAVLCVTGDHPAARSRQGDPAVFMAEGTLIANEARRAGAVVAVAESPAAPPVRRRAQRLGVKQAAGADVALLNHAGTVDDLLDFGARVRGEEVDLAMVAPVPVITDQRSVDALAQFPGVELPAEEVGRIVDATDPVGTGVDLAVRSARTLLESGLFGGVNLSGIATRFGPAERSRIMRRIARRLAHD